MKKLAHYLVLFYMVFVFVFMGAYLIIDSLGFTWPGAQKKLAMLPIEAIRIGRTYKVVKKKKDEKTITALAVAFLKIGNKYKNVIVERAQWGVRKYMPHDGGKRIIRAIKRMQKTYLLGDMLRYAETTCQVLQDSYRHCYSPLPDSDFFCHQSFPYRDCRKSLRAHVKKL